MKPRARARPRALTRVLFWPFAHDGNPGAEAGVADLGEALGARLEEWAAEPGCRQHPLAARTRLEMRDFLAVEDLLTWRRDLRRRFEACRRRGDFPVVVGGNHLVLLPVLEAYAAAGERVLCVSFDAHLDAYDLSTTKEPLHHGNFLLHLRRPRRLSIVNVGHRDRTLAPAAVREHFDRAFAIEEVAALGIEGTVAAIGRLARRFDRVHLDVDLDVLDPSALRAVGTPMPAGLSTLELCRLIDGLPAGKLAGVTLSEYNASLDADGAGQHLVLWLLERMLLARVEGG